MAKVDVDLSLLENKFPEDLPASLSRLQVDYATKQLTPTAREAVKAYVLTEQAELLKAIAPCVTVDVVRFTRRCAAIVGVETEARIASIEKMLVDSQVSASAKVIAEAEKIVPAIVATLKSSINTLPAGMSLWAEVRPEPKAENQMVISYSVEATTQVRHEPGKRGKEPSFGVKITDAENKIHEYASIKEAAKWFLIPADQEMPYSRASFETKALKRYKAKKVEFVEK